MLGRRCTRGVTKSAPAANTCVLRAFRYNWGLLREAQSVGATTNTIHKVSDCKASQVRFVLGCELEVLEVTSATLQSEFASRERFALGYS